ncbi:MAG: hypothetical protein ACLSCR_09740 [Akkermansia sp.]
MKPVIGYTLGDQAGIGPEVVAAALSSGELPAEAEYRLIGRRRTSAWAGRIRNPPAMPLNIWNRRLRRSGKESSTPS